VRQPLDHQHLNHAVPEFAPGGAVPTSENILLHLWPRLAREIAALGADSRLLRLRLHEEQGFHVDYSGDDGPPAA
jgi:6-pyruvoyl-tetrahydropterin synthase